MLDWQDYESCPVCKQEAGQPCRDGRYKNSIKYAILPHDIRKMGKGKEMGAYAVTGILNNGKDRNYVQLAAHADMAEADEIARSNSVVFDFDEVQVKQNNGIIIRKYAKGELVER